MGWPPQRRSTASFGARTMITSVVSTALFNRVPTFSSTGPPCTSERHRAADASSCLQTAEHTECDPKPLTVRSTQTEGHREVEREGQVTHHRRGRQDKPEDDHDELARRRRCFDALWTVRLAPLGGRS